jgi:hypothetical protein
MNYDKILINYLTVLHIVALTYLFTLGAGNINIWQWNTTSQVFYVLLSICIIAFFRYIKRTMI